jgi:hypothetical protein
MKTNREVKRPFASEARIEYFQSPLPEKKKSLKPKILYYTDFN